MCVWLGWHINNVNKQKKAVEWVRVNGGMVYYDFQLDDDFHQMNEVLPPVPQWVMATAWIGFL